MNSHIPSLNPDPATANANAVAAVRSHRILIRVLTGAAFVFGVLALTAGILIAWCYPVFVLPKQRELTQDASVLLHQYQTSAAVSQPASDAAKQMGELLSVEIAVTNVATMGTALVSLAVGVLGLGVLVLLMVVVLNRRATLNQVNSSLAQISRQLRELQHPRDSS